MPKRIILLTPILFRIDYYNVVYLIKTPEMGRRRFGINSKSLYILSTRFLIFGEFYRKCGRPKKDPKGAVLIKAIAICSLFYVLRCPSPIVVLPWHFFSPEIPLSVTYVFGIFCYLYLNKDNFKIKFSPLYNYCHVFL